MLKRISSYLLITCLILVSFSFTKQNDIEKLSLCQSINKVAKAFDEDKVQALLGEANGTEDGITIYDTNVDVDGLDDEFIAESESETVFFATYVNKSQAKLKEKFADLKKQIAKCLGKQFETDKLEDMETATFKYSEKVSVELTIYFDDGEIDLNIDISKE